MASVERRQVSYTVLGPMCPEELWFNNHWNLMEDIFPSTDWSRSLTITTKDVSQDLG